MMHMCEKSQEMKTIKQMNKLRNIPDISDKPQKPVATGSPSSKKCFVIVIFSYLFVHI